MLQAPIDYVSGLGQIPDFTRTLQQQEAFKVGLEGAKADAEYKRAQVDAQGKKLRRQAEFQAAMQAYVANPTTKGLAALLGAFPEFSEEAKTAFGALDAERQKVDVRQMGEITALAARGDYDGAAAKLRQRIEADTVAGQPPDPNDQAILSAIESGDPARQKAAMAMMTVAIGQAVGYDNAKPFLESTGLSRQRRTKVVDGILIDEETGEAIAESPYPQVVSGPGGTHIQPRSPDIPKFGLGGDGGFLQRGAVGGTSSPGGTAPAAGGQPQTIIASALSSIMGPASVAGFLGNFDVEGGYTGARGDGGKAAGIAQWHPDRLANYQSAIGRPFNPADHEGQARFVIWEMQNPEKAFVPKRYKGRVLSPVEQRDMILNAPNAAVAADLIDRFYERSSGQHRQERVKAARRYANNPVAAGRAEITEADIPQLRRHYDAVTPEQAPALFRDGQKIPFEEFLEIAKRGIVDPASTVVKVRSLQEAMALPEGTLFEDPYGVVRKR